MARVLLVPHAPTVGIAHLGACLAVGGELRARGHDVTVAYGGRRPELIEAEGFSWYRVPEIAPEREWQPAAWFASKAELRSMVEAHRAGMENLRPDVAVSSSGVAGRLACEVAEVPQVNLMHYVAVSSYGRSATVWRNRMRDARRPRRAARVGRVRLRSMRRRSGGETATASVVARARTEMGLPAPGEEAFMGCDDSLVAMTTTPFIDPADRLPERWRYVGPVVWSASGKLAEGAIQRTERPLVYVTQGSTGDPDLLRLAVSELAAEPVDVLVTTGGLCEPRDIERLGANVRAADLLPGRACLEAADAAVIHGGHLTFCEALLAGTPFVVLPYRNDQIGRVNRTERLGVGIGVWPRPLLGGAVSRAVRRLLRRPRYRSRSHDLAARLRDDWDGRRNAADLVEGLIR
jgi:MGT family glycosyltransferase